MQENNITQFINSFSKSIALERKFGFCNVEGKTCRFIEHIRKELENLEKNITNIPIRIVRRLKYIFKNYENISVSERKQVLIESESIINNFKNYLIENESYKEKKLVSQIKDSTKRYNHTDKDKYSKNWEKTPVQFVKGVGPVMAGNLAKAGILTVRDLIYYYPRKHLDYKNRTKIKDCKVGKEVTIWGIIKSSQCFTSPRNKNLTILTIKVTDGTGVIRASWFYSGSSYYLQGQYKKRFPEGATILMSGTVKIDKYSRSLTIDRPEVEVLGFDEDKSNGTSLHVGRIVPVYPLVEGLNLKWLRKSIYNAIEIYKDKIEEPLNEQIIKKYNLLNLSMALKEFHFPTDKYLLEKARYRLVFSEFLNLQLCLLYRRKQYELLEEPPSPLKGEGELIKRFLEQLPFKLTKAQTKVFNEIKNDLEKTEPMNRLLQGDVGSGKTVVALMALLIAVQNGYQGAIMAPTEILAEQHYNKFIEWVLPLGLKVELLLGSQGIKSRKESLTNIKSGYANIIVGTHALIQEDVEFNKLGLIVIDEQHRFGVKQRNLLRSKGQNPKVLTMTATPIPRTLALALHGDLDVSVIDELPPGRKPVDTFIKKGKKGREEVWKLVRSEVSKGRQVYVVYPLIEESEKLSASAAITGAETLKSIFPEFRIGLLHGQLKPQEKDKIMTSFINKEIDILVCTTVIEVGVDVKNATVMIIENSERFGLAQLHQLRGRVGRGAEKSYCILLSDHPSDISEQRLNVMCSTNDGFIIAEQDLRLRGPGEFLGTKQSGLPDLLIADIIKDTQILNIARNAAIEIINDDPLLVKPYNELLKKELKLFFKDKEEFLSD